MRDGFKIFDTDCHHMEPATVWGDYIDPAFKGREPRREQYGKRQVLMVEGEPIQAQEEEGKYPMNAPEFLDAVAVAMKRFDRASKAKFSAASRLEDMDEEGVDAQILYPTYGGQILGREFKDPELLSALCRGYNKWSKEYCSENAERLRWAAMIPLQDPALAVEEVEWVAANGAISCYIRPNPVKGRNLYHEEYDPLWAAMERLGIPLSIHDSGSPRLPSYGDRMDSHTAGHILSHPFEAMSAMAGFIWFGVTERFPNLKIIHVEADAGWVPYWLQRMEQHYEFSGNAEHPELRMSPTEYFKRNFFVAARGDEMTLKAAVELVGDDYFLFNTDYPHPDGTWPWGMQSMVDQPISDESKRKILWDNAVRAYGLEA